jgi:5,10-methylenetetrahydrofolate reductase
MQQYFKMEKKIASGARFIITQLGYDWKKSQELFRYLRVKNSNIAYSICSTVQSWTPITEAFIYSKP